jgi:hypothetical protein
MFEGAAFLHPVVVQRAPGELPECIDDNSRIAYGSTESIFPTPEDA